MYERLIAISREAFEQGGYETAYHALAAALHRAQDVGSSALLAQVQQLAMQHLRRLDEPSPTHPPVLALGCHTRDEKYLPAVGLTGEGHEAAGHSPAGIPGAVSGGRASRTGCSILLATAACLPSSSRFLTIARTRGSSLLTTSSSSGSSSGRSSASADCKLVLLSCFLLLVSVVDFFPFSLGVHRLHGGLFPENGDHDAHTASAAHPLRSRTDGSLEALSLELLEGKECCRKT